MFPKRKEHPCCVRGLGLDLPKTRLFWGQSRSIFVFVSRGKAAEPHRPQYSIQRTARPPPTTVSTDSPTAPTTLARPRSAMPSLPAAERTSYVVWLCLARPGLGGLRRITRCANGCLWLKPGLAKAKPRGRPLGVAGVRWGLLWEAGWTDLCLGSPILAVLSFYLSACLSVLALR